MVADFARKRGGFTLANVWGIADDGVESLRGAVKCPRSLEQVAERKMDALGDPVSFGVATSYSKRGRRNIAGEKTCLRQLLCQRDGDAARTGTDIGDEHSGAIGDLRAA